MRPSVAHRGFASTTQGPSGGESNASGAEDEDGADSEGRDLAVLSAWIARKGGYVHPRLVMRAFPDAGVGGALEVTAIASRSARRPGERGLGSHSRGLWAGGGVSPPPSRASMKGGPRTGCPWDGGINTRPLGRGAGAWGCLAR